MRTLVQSVGQLGLSIRTHSCRYSGDRAMFARYVPVEEPLTMTLRDGSVVPPLSGRHIRMCPSNGR